MNMQCLCTRGWMSMMSLATLALSSPALADITYQFNHTFTTTVAGNYDDVLTLNAPLSLANFNMTGMTVMFDSGVERSGDVFFCITVPSATIKWDAYLGSSSGRPFQMYNAFASPTAETSFAWSNSAPAVVGQAYALEFSQSLLLSASHGAFMVMAADPTTAAFSGSVTLHGQFVPAPSCLALLCVGGITRRRRR